MPLTVTTLQLLQFMQQAKDDLISAESQWSPLHLSNPKTRHSQAQPTQHGTTSPSAAAVSTSHLQAPV